MTNPLLTSSGLTSFADIRPEHVGPALDALLGEADAALAALRQRLQDRIAETQQAMEQLG